MSSGKVVFINQSTDWYVVQIKEHGYLLFETDVADIDLGDLISGDFGTRGVKVKFRNITRRKEFDVFIVDNFLSRENLRKLYGF